MADASTKAAATPAAASPAAPPNAIFRVAGGKAQNVSKSAGPAGTGSGGSDFFDSEKKDGGGEGGDGEMTAAELQALEHGSCRDKIMEMCCKSSSHAEYQQLGDKNSTDPFAKMPMCKRVFPLLYGDNAGWRQLVFFILFFVPVLTVLVISILTSLPTDRVVEFRMPSAPVLVESDHCNIVFEAASPAMATPLAPGQLMLTLKLGAPRGLTGDDDTFVKMCGSGVSAAQPCAGPHANPVAGQETCAANRGAWDCVAAVLKREPKGEAIGNNHGCSTLSGAVAVGTKHLCVMNAADKTFVDMAYGNWDCTISVAVPAGEAFPNVTLASTESVFYPELTRVLVADAEADTITRRGGGLGGGPKGDDGDDPKLKLSLPADGITQQLREGMGAAAVDRSGDYRDNRHSICLRRLNFTNLRIALPDTRVELDCFTASGAIELVDTGSTHFHLFSDADGASPTERMDVALNEGDLYLWSHRPVQMLYDASVAAPAVSQLCLAGREVLGPSACGASKHTLLPTQRAAGSSEAAACAQPGALQLTVNNAVAAAYAAALPLPNATNASAVPNIFNHVQVEVGGFHDSIYEVGKSFNRDGTVSADQPIKVVLDGASATSNMPTFSAVDRARLTSLFHHDDAAVPDEQMVELQVIGEGIPGGRFVWYANPVYAYLAPELLSFLSLNLLTPSAITVQLELVDNFCPLVHMAKSQATMEVIEQVYRALYAALAPLPTHSVFGFTQFNEPYPGLTYGVPPLRTTLNDYMFFRDGTSPKQFVTLTRNAARRANAIFQLMLTFNVLLTLLSALLFVYFAIKILTLKKREMLFELVESYRHDLGAVKYHELEREHKKQEMQEKAESAKIEYKVIVRTGSHREGGLAGRVFVTLVGKTDETREIALDDEQGRPVFSSGNAASFTVKAADVGRIQSVRVRSQPDGDAFGHPDWLLDSMSVLAPRFEPCTKPPFLDVRETVHFPCNRWFSETEKDQKARTNSHNVKGEDEGLQQLLTPGELLDGKTRPKAGGTRAGMFTKAELKVRLEPEDDEDSSDDEIEPDMQLDDHRRAMLHTQLTDIMNPRASPFWLVDVMMCANKRRSDVKEMGGEIDPRQEDEACRLFKHKLLNKYLTKWGAKVDEGRREIMTKFPALVSTLQLDDDGCRTVDCETGRAQGATVIRQGVAKGYRAKKTLVSDLSEAERLKLKRASELEMEQNFHLFDPAGIEQLGASEVRVAMKARGIRMSMREAREVIDDLDSTGDRKMNLAEYKTLVMLKNRELPENYEAMYAFKLFADPILNCINFKQLKRVCNELGYDMNDTELVEMIDRVDLQGEGVVTEEEFLEVMGTPTNADAVKAKIKALQIPAPEGGGGAWESARGKSAAPDRVMFERLVARYWRRYRMMDEESKARFLKCAAYAAVPGNFMDALPKRATLALLGCSPRDARGILKHARTQLRLESFQAWFALTVKEQDQMVRAILEFPAEYFNMGITKRRWFYKQCIADRHAYLKKAQDAAQAEVLDGFRAKLGLEAKSSFVHTLILFAPCLPLMMAGALFDKTYKKFNPDADQSSYGATFWICVVINFVYVATGYVYLTWSYIVKNIKSRMGKEGPVEKKLRLIFYACLFVVMFCAILVLVCVMYWIVLGTVLYPAKVVPYMVAATVFFAHIGKMWGLLQMFRRVILTQIASIINRAQRMKMKAAVYKSKVTAQKSAFLTAAAAKSGGEAKQLEAKAHKLAAVEDHLREVMAQCARTDNVAVEFLVKQGFSTADILVAVVGSALTLLLLLIFIAVGVAAFTTPGGVAASINSALSVVAGKVSSGASDAANSPDKLERLVELVEQACDVVMAPALEALGLAQEQGAELVPVEDE